ncbi:hypothetical protein E3Q09_03386 [Wallemia mellicola]|nr:hypothetical protein E3Q09_03386 [Wallemia mellicola]
MSLWVGDLGFWLATWGAGVFVSKGGDTIVSCAGSEAESLRCLVDASTTVLSGAAIILGGHSQVFLIADLHYLGLAFVVHPIFRIL